jgi:hypothetical protein
MKFNHDAKRRDEKEEMRKKMEELSKRKYDNRTLRLAHRKQFKDNFRQHRGSATNPKPTERTLSPPTRNTTYKTNGKP